MNMQERHLNHKSEQCVGAASAVRDALYVLNGKWKLPLIMTLMSGPKRFNEIQRELEEISPKILSKELKELELNEFVVREVTDTHPISVTYTLTSYSDSLDKVLQELRNWGVQHRERIVTSRRKSIAA